MMLACVPFAMLLPLQPMILSQQDADSPASESHTPATITGTKDERTAKAADFYGQGRFVEASLEFEGLRRDYPDEQRFLFNSGATRYAAQHYAHAITYFTEYLARSDIKPADRKEAQAQLDEARRNVAPVQVSVRVPPGAEGQLTIVVRHIARGSSDIRPDLLFPALPTNGTATLPVQLEPGAWTILARGDGYTEAKQTLEVRGLAGRRVALQLAAAPVASETPTETNTTPEGPSTEDAPPPRSGRKFALGLTTVGGVTTVAGIAVLTAGILKRGGVADCEPASYGACKTDLMLGLRTRDAGAGVLGAGVGVLVGGLTWLGRDAQARKKVWIATTVIGGVAIAGGYAGLLLTSKTFNTANTTKLADGGWADHYGGAGNAPLKATTAAVFGLGIGLVTSSVASLIVQRTRPGAGLRALRIDGSASPWLTGVIVSGRF